MPCRRATSDVASFDPLEAFQDVAVRFLTDSERSDLPNPWLWRVGPESHRDVLASLVTFGDVYHGFLLGTRTSLFGCSDFGDPSPLLAWAKQLGLSDAEALIQETLVEEENTDQLLSELAEEAINPTSAA
jgi:hypothetical protein